MARTVNTPPPLPADMITVNLNRLLSRLDKKLPPLPTGRNGVGAGSSPLLKPGELPGPVERRKIAANLEYARQLLLHLETEYATIKNSAQRKQVQEELARRKAVIRRLNERLHGVEQLEIMWEEEEEGEGEKSRGGGGGGGKTGVEPTSTLRNRIGGAPQATAMSTSSSTNPHQLSSTNPTTAITTTTTTNASTAAATQSPADLDKQLSLHQRQQDEITSDLLAMSRALKKSSLQFGQQLEEEKPYLDVAAQGLDKNVLGMQQMGGKMDRLRKDGSVGWYRTIVNMVIIVVLGLVGLIILMLPKLRR